MLLSISDCPLIWGEYGVITPKPGTANSSNKPCTPLVTPFLPYNIVDAAAIIADNEPGGGCSSIGAIGCRKQNKYFDCGLVQSITIGSNEITFDGNGHSLTRSVTGEGAYI